MKIIALLLLVGTSFFQCAWSMETPVGAEACRQVSEYRVTSLADTGERGTLRHGLTTASVNPFALSKLCRRIFFDVAGTITLLAPLPIRFSYVTIDGCGADAPGVTIAQDSKVRRGIVLDGTAKHLRDVAIKCIRFRGLHRELKRHRVKEAVLSLDGDCTRKTECAPTWGGWRERGGVSRVLLEKITYAHATDKLTIWGKIKDVTVADSFFYRSPLALLVSYYGSQVDLEKRDITIRGNVFAENNERNPQLRGWIHGMLIAENIIHAWDAFPPLKDIQGHPGDGYGIRIKNEVGEKSINAAIVGNVFTGSKLAAGRALIYGLRPGPELDGIGPIKCLQQGELWQQGRMGELVVHGNLLPESNCDHYSTVPTPDQWQGFEFGGDFCQRTTAKVGMPFKTFEENRLLEQATKACEARMASL